MSQFPQKATGAHLTRLTRARGSLPPRRNDSAEAHDPVVFLAAVGKDARLEYEYVVLRLAPTASGTRARLSLSTKAEPAAWGTVDTDSASAPTGGRARGRVTASFRLARGTPRRA